MGLLRRVLKDEVREERCLFWWEAPRERRAENPGTAEEDGLGVGARETGLGAFWELCGDVKVEGQLVIGR